MKYRHRFHAGNFADVHKHVALLALLRALQHKDKGLLYVDTHAGAGAYELAGADTRHGAEARHGVLSLLGAPEPATAELQDYRQAVLRWRREHGRPQAYPGSALLAAQALRSQDRALCCERLPQECRALRAALGHPRRLRVECADGYEQLIASLPPVERRCLVLIDPPYEDAVAEMRQALRTLGGALQRLAHCVIALWYPIKDERWTLVWQQELSRAVSAPAVGLELWLYPRDAGVALNGSGLVVINPPWQFATRAAHWQRELGGILDPLHQGGGDVRTLVGDNIGHGQA